MHLGVDGSFWGGRERGVAVATRRLFVSLASPATDPRITAFVSDSAPLPEALATSQGPIRLIATRRRQGVRRAIWQQCVLPGLARAHGIDLLYCPCYTAPLRSTVPTVVTIHDMIAWKQPRMCHWPNLLHLRAVVAHGVQRAVAVTVPTESVRADLLRILRPPAHKVHVVPWGVDAEIARVPPEQARRQVAERFGLHGPFVLFAGCLEPKKNVHALLRASQAAGTTLVLVGPPGWGDRRLRRQLRLGPRNACRHLGYVTPLELGALYSATEVVHIR